MKASAKTLFILTVIFAAGMIVFAGLYISTFFKAPLVSGVHTVEFKTQSGMSCIVGANIVDTGEEPGAYYIRYPGISYYLGESTDMGNLSDRFLPVIDGFYNAAMKYFERYPKTAAIDCTITEFNSERLSAVFRGVGVTSEGAVESVCDPLSIDIPAA